MIDNAKSFKEQISAPGEEATKAHAELIATNIIEEAAQRGIHMSQDDAFALPSVRLAAFLKEDIPVGDWWSEFEASGADSYKKYANEKAIMDAVNDAKNDRHLDAVAELETELSKLSPAEKMRRARQLGQRLPGPLTGARQELTTEEKAKAISDMERLPAAMKMARYREVFG